MCYGRRSGCAIEADLFGPMPPRPPWGSPAAKVWEIERIRRETALRKLKQGSGE